MSLGARSALAFVCLLTLAGCTPEPRGLEWFIIPNADIGARMTFVEATIRRGSCFGEEVYRSGYAVDGGTMAMEPPVLEPGTWAFGARVHDASCAWIAEGCLTLALPFPDPIELFLTDPPSEPTACAAAQCFGGICEGSVPMDAEVPDGDTAPPDSRVPGCELWTPQHFDACALPAPMGAITIVGAGSYNTMTGTLVDGGMASMLPSVVVDQGGIAARIVSVEGFSVAVGATFRVVGEMPLIIASWGDIDVIGDLDVSSARANTPGAGADPSLCSAAMPGGSGPGGSGGGGGGAFHGNGGDGGRGNGNMLDGPTYPGGAGGGSTAAPSTVRGGCNGADSGTGMMFVPAPGGAGGGAIQLSARGNVRVAGRILAGGAGGTGGLTDQATGGGGGGSGGFIGLDAQTVTVTGGLSANGGGGAEGSDRSTTGVNGEDGDASETRAAGGAGGAATTTDGGDGGAGTTHSGDSVTGIDVGGGGGGGGATGFVLVWSADWSETDAVISPPAIVRP